MGKKAELSLETRSVMLAKFSAGINMKDIASEYHLSRQTVHYQINKVENYKAVNILGDQVPKVKETLLITECCYVNLKKSSLKRQNDQIFLNLTPKTAISERIFRRRLEEKILKHLDQRT